MTAELGSSQAHADSVHAHTSPSWTFESRDPDRAHQHLTESLGAHRMELPDGVVDFLARAQTTSMPGVQVHRMTYGGAAVDLRPEPNDDHIVVIHPLAGRIGVSSDSVGVVSNPLLPVVLDAGKRYRAHWSKNSVVYKVVIHRNLAREVAAESRGLSAEMVSLDFSLQLQPAGPAIETWGRIVAVLAAQTGAFGDSRVPTLTEFHLARATASALLDAFPAAIRVSADERVPFISCPPVDHAVSYIEEHAEDPLTLRDIALSVGLSSRALQMAFRRHRDMTPMEYVRKVRLQRAYDDLAAAELESTTVATVAARWGHHNPGRFASEFRSVYGRYPKEVLAQ